MDGTSAGFEKLGRARTGQENLGEGEWVSPKIQSETGFFLVHFSDPAAAKPEQMDLLQAGIKFVELFGWVQLLLSPHFFAALFHHLGFAAQDSPFLGFRAAGFRLTAAASGTLTILCLEFVLFHPLFKHCTPGMDPSTTLFITQTCSFQTS